MFDEITLVNVPVTRQYLKFYGNPMAYYRY